MKPASSRCRNSPATSPKPPRTCAAACNPSLPGPGEPALVAKLREGFEGIERSFLALLERNGIVATDPTGAAFDPNLHQAMAEQETTEHPPGTVIQTWSLAWTLNGRLLRPAMVVVAKHPTAELGAPKLDTTA